MGWFSLKKRDYLPGVMHPTFEIVTTSAGAVSILNKEVNEIMHNPVGPWVEANALYIEQANLKERWLTLNQEELVIYDVGLGAAANALAALHCIRANPQPNKRLRLVSFERDLELLRFALRNASLFAHFQGYEEMIACLLERHEWIDDQLTWTLHEGDFFETVDSEKSQPHLVFFDPYSPKVNTTMWTTAAFQKLNEKSRSPETGGTVLYTYSQSTPIRVALFQAGFFVGKGMTTGFKEETTQASTQLELLHEPLGARWLERWKRSRSPFPLNASAEEQPRILNLILNHSQFKTQ